MNKRRTFLQMTMAAAASTGMPWHLYVQKAYGAILQTGLSDPAAQPKFAQVVPNALNPAFIYAQGDKKKKEGFEIGVSQSIQYTGLEKNGIKVPTTIWGYGDGKGPFAYSWPGRTFEVRSGVPIDVLWENKLDGLPLPVTSFGRSVVDTSLHWAYSLHGYDRFSLEQDGFPIVPHVHGGHNDFQFDGNPEFFFSPNWGVRGPQWRDKEYTYKNDQPAGTVWYHDHALGITRLNVYAGMAGFFIIRDDDDTGDEGNPLDLPAYPYETALAIQDKMFDENGGLFYPAYPGDPFYADFIYGEGASLSSGSPEHFSLFDNPNYPDEPESGYGPTALAEFFGDHIVVNGLIWPKMDVEPRNYRLRLLNGCDSRFLVVRFRKAASPTSTDLEGAGEPIPFTVIGGDQGLRSSPQAGVTQLVIETGSRYDIIFDFGRAGIGADDRIILENTGWDSPFGFDFGPGAIEGEDVFVDRQTDRIMAFDVRLPLSAVPDVSPSTAAVAAYAAQRAADYEAYQPAASTRTRKVALFEGTDEYGRLQPLLGTAEPATDYEGNPVYWPDEPAYANAGLVGQMQGSIGWHSPTTENPALGATEEWQIFNATGDSHPIHLHLVHFEVVQRREIVWDSRTSEDSRVLPPGSGIGDGTYLVQQPVVQHNGTLGSGFRVVNPTYGAVVDPGPEYVDGEVPKDLVTARPDEVTIIRAKFDKPGRYVWHCHILSHEDHEMMRVLAVGPERNPDDLGSAGDNGNRGRHQ